MSDYTELYFDYEHQAWVRHGLYLRCGHLEAVDCGCYGRIHEGEAAPVGTESHQTTHSGSNHG